MCIEYLNCNEIKSSKDNEIKRRVSQACSGLNQITNERALGTVPDTQPQRYYHTE